MEGCELALGRTWRPSTPAVERRRHAVPAPHRNRSVERTGQGPLQGGGQHGQRPGCCPEVPSAPRRLAHHQQRQGADGVNAPGPSPNSSPTPVRGPFLHPLEELQVFRSPQLVLPEVVVVHDAQSCPLNERGCRAAISSQLVPSSFHQPSLTVSSSQLKLTMANCRKA